MIRLLASRFVSGMLPATHRQNSSDNYLTRKSPFRRAFYMSCSTHIFATLGEAMDSDKEKSRAFAIKRFPRMSFSRKKDAGRAEALLIALWHKETSP